MMKKVMKKISKKRTMTSSRAKKSNVSETKKAVRRKSITNDEFFALVGTRAYELWEQRGYSHGNDQYDWFQAEQSLRSLYKIK